MEGEGEGKEEGGEGTPRKKFDKSSTGFITHISAYFLGNCILYIL